MSDPTTFDYQLNRLTFQNGERLNFPASTRLRYGDQHRGVWIEMEPAVRRKILAQILERNDPSRKFQELRRIDYKMLVTADGRLRGFGFKHFLKPGSGVGLERFDDGDLFFQEARQGSMYTKNYTLSDVTEGEIDSDFKVWQFHGYRHEH